jgi:hypothetical protein
VPVYSEDTGDLNWYGIDSNASTVQKSLDLAGASDGTGLLQLHQFNNPNGGGYYTPASDDLLLMRAHIVYPLEKYELLYATKADFADWLQSELSISWSQISDPYATDYGGPITWSQITDPPAIVTAHSALTDIVASAVDVDDHDPRYWFAYGVGTPSTVADTKNYRTSGEVWADDFKLNDADTTNYWNGDDLFVSVAEDVGIYAGDTAEFGADNQVDIYSDTGSVTLSAETTVYLVATTNDLDMTIGGDLKINANTGQTVTKTWVDNDLVTHSETFHKGILVAYT